MRHRKAGTKLNRTASHRKAMMRNMITSLFEHERVVTTKAKAKAVQPLAEKMITLAKRGDLHARRQALAVLTKKSVTHKLFSEVKDKYMDRSGGYTSIVKIGFRRGDAAELAVLQLIDPEDWAKAKKKVRKRRGVFRRKAASEAKDAPKKETALAPKPEAAAPPAPAPEPGPESQTGEKPEEESPK